MHLNLLDFDAVVVERFGNALLIGFLLRCVNTHTHSGRSKQIERWEAVMRVFVSGVVTVEFTLCCAEKIACGWVATLLEHGGVFLRLLALLFGSRCHHRLHFLGLVVVVVAQEVGVCGWLVVGVFHYFAIEFTMRDNLIFQRFIHRFDGFVGNHNPQKHHKHIHAHHSIESEQPGEQFVELFTKIAA